MASCQELVPLGRRGLCCVSCSDVVINVVVVDVVLELMLCLMQCCVSCCVDEAMLAWEEGSIAAHDMENGQVLYQIACL